LFSIPLATSQKAALKTLRVEFSDKVGNRVEKIYTF